MSIDKAVAELTAALDRNTAALLAAAASAGAASAAGAADKPAKPAKADKPAKSSVTQEQMQAAVIKIKDEFGLDEAKKIIKEAGKCDKMGEIKEANYQAVHDAAVKRYEELSSGNTGGGDDI